MNIDSFIGGNNIEVGFYNIRMLDILSWFVCTSATIALPHHLYIKKIVLLNKHLGILETYRVVHSISYSSSTPPTCATQNIRLESPHK